MQVLNNVQALDDYAAALTLESKLPLGSGGGRLTYLVANQSAVARFRPLLELGGSEHAEYGPEIILTPQTGVIDHISGVRFRNAVAGSAARIIAQLSEPGDVIPAAGTPFTQTIQGSGSIATLGVLDRITAPIDVAGVNTEQTIYNFDLPAGVLGLTGILELRAGGDYLHNNAAGDTLRFRIYLGLTGGALTPIYDITSTLTENVAGVTAQRHPWDLYFRLQNRGAANSQTWQGDLNVESVNVATLPAVGLGYMDPTGGGPARNKPSPIGLGPGAYVFDSTQGLTIRVTVTWSAASANNSWAIRNGYLTVQ